MAAGEVLADKVRLPRDGSDLVVIDGATGRIQTGTTTDLNGAYLKVADHRIAGAQRIGSRTLEYTYWQTGGAVATLTKNVWTPIAADGVDGDVIIHDVFAYLHEVFEGAPIISASMQVGEDLTPDVDAYRLSTNVLALPNNRWLVSAVNKATQLKDGTTVRLPLGQSLTATLTVSPTNLLNLIRGRITFYWIYSHLPALPP